MKIIAGIVGAAALAVAGSVQAEPVRYETDPDHTFVTFEVVHFNTSTVRARFDDVGGFVELDKDAGKGRAEITIDTDSISSGVDAFDDHLETDDFFSVDKYPQATFVSKQFKFEDDTIKTIEGELTLLGQTHPVTLQSKRFNCYDSPVLKKPVCGGDFETTIKRSQWGMNWGIEMGVPDDVRLLIQIEAVRQ